jgi:S-DNA-T family DNA segregation ATPase FtsK/SpoIIIE
MSAPEDAAVIPADPVLDGELLDDRSTGQRQQFRRVVLWWQRSPRVPTVLKSCAHAVQAARNAAVSVICAPWWFVGAAGRGTVLAVRAWRRWVTVHDYREAAEQSEKLADKYVEIRELTLFRWRVTGALVGGGTAGVAVSSMLYGCRVLWLTVVIV